MARHGILRTASALAAAFAAAQSLAFRPPVGVGDGGVEVRLLELDADGGGAERIYRPREYDCAGRAVPLEAEVRNGPDGELRGTLSFVMDGDWMVEPSSFPVDVPPGGRVALKAEAWAKPSAIDAPYPVRAVLSRPGAADVEAVAVFAAKGLGRAPSGPVGAVARLGGEADDVVLGRARRGAEAALSGCVAEAGSEGVAPFLLEADGEVFGCAVAPGAAGLADGAIAWTDGEKSVALGGFAVDLLLADGAEDARIAGASVRRTPGGAVEIMHRVVSAGKEAAVLRATASAKGGALTVAWDIPSPVRSRRGLPRYARLSPGRADRAVFRLFEGMGNVLECPGNVEFPAGVRMSTRHVAAEYDGGSALLFATDVFPDRLVCRGREGLVGLESSHDTAFSFIPSSRGAFAAARRFAQACGYRKSPGHDRAAGRVWIDSWGGNFLDTKEKIERAAAAGVTNAVLVKHDWQRFGWDYRLPDVWPPHGKGWPPSDGTAEFMEMREAARKAGHLFGVHDNYTDFYPDASGYSYRHVAFAADGSPCRAWLHPQLAAQSYRWLASAPGPWIDRNMRLVREGCAPEAVFIDVFASVPPMDQFDRAGTFHSRVETAMLWGAALDRARRGLGGAVVASEGGNDIMCGLVDAGWCDHHTAGRWMGRKDYVDSERIPWNDIVTHGKMILVGGGLADRYAESGDPAVIAAHGYGSDDYMCTTVVGGRAPACLLGDLDGCVATFRTVGDVCAELARREFTAFEFCDGDIHRQHATFSDGGEAWVNRGEAPWTVGDMILPQNGFYARAGGIEAGIVAEGGVRRRFSRRISP